MVSMCGPKTPLYCIWTETKCTIHFCENLTCFYQPIASQILLLINLFKVPGELLFQIRFVTNKIDEMQKQRSEFYRSLVNCKKPQVLKCKQKPLANLSYLPKTVSCPIALWEKNRTPTRTFPLLVQSELPSTFSLLLIASVKTRLNSLMRTHCFLQYYIYIYI